jgi:predicted DNA-binding antitoxin AbrB/MazE fold protein
MKVVEAIYEDGVLKLVKPGKIEDDIVMVKILNRDEILTDEDMEDILKALSEREKGNYYKMEEVFDV